MDTNSLFKSRYTMYPLSSLHANHGIRITKKIAYVVFMASRKQRHYFQECSITVASEVPLNDIINNRDATGRIAKWAIELLPFDITYKPRRAIKLQVLADFITEWTEAELPKEYGAYSNWIMHFDGSKMLAELGAGVILTSPTGDSVQYVLQIMYTDSNNAAEYEALLHGLRMAVSMGIQRLEVRGDSNLAISQKMETSMPRIRKWQLIAMSS